MDSVKDRVDGIIRYAATSLVRLAVTDATETKLDFTKERFQKILLVRPSFRMGNSILATPGIFLFRQNFPGARIDFVGGSIAKTLFENLPIDHHYQITRRFPDASWAYFALLKRIRTVGYDLAVELSGTQSAMGAVLVGLSGARYRVGVKGKWDHWYNVKVIKPASRNKYEASAQFLGNLGLEGDPMLPHIALSTNEKQEALRKLARTLGEPAPPDVGVFLGGRMRKQKRWPKENFLQLIRSLQKQRLRIVVFVGPDEQELAGFFRSELKSTVPVIYEQSLRLFAAMISTCKLFVACDSGPVHLACALRVPTVAIFQKANFRHWGPPSSLARIVHEPGAISPETVLQACVIELARSAGTRPEPVSAGVSRSGDTA